MKDSTIITVAFGGFLSLAYICAAFNGVNGTAFTIFTNALILIGTGKIILDKRRNNDVLPPNEFK